MLHLLRGATCSRCSTCNTLILREKCEAEAQQPLLLLQIRDSLHQLPSFLRRGGFWYPSVRHESERIAGQLMQLDVVALALFHVRADRKSTRLNSSHVKISYAVFC